MNRIYIFLLVVLLSSCNSETVKPVVEDPVKPVVEESAPEKEVTLEAYCEKNACRKNTRVKFLTANGAFDQVIGLYWPVVQGEQISLLPGDKVYIEAAIEGNKFVNFHQVYEITQPEKTITFDFSQKGEEVGMMLNVANPFSKQMKFHLDMIDFEGNTHQTSSCAVIAGGSVFEMWPHSIPELAVSNIRALPVTEQIACEY